MGCRAAECGAGDSGLRRGRWDHGSLLPLFPSEARADGALHCTAGFCRDRGRILCHE